MAAAVPEETEEEAENSARKMSLLRAPGDSNDISDTAGDSVIAKSNSGVEIDHITS